MKRIEHQVLIRRPVTEVFAFLDDPARLPAWQNGVVAARRDGPPTVGTREIHERSVFGRRVKNHMQITAYETDQRYGVRGLSGPVPYTFTSTVTPVSEGTQVNVVLEVQPRGIVRLASPVLGRMLARQLRSDFARLQHLMESGQH